MLDGLLPIGSVVLVGQSKKKVMIVGWCQKGGRDRVRLWDYTGVIYPEGYLDSNKMFLFNNDQITRIFALGYQDDEQIAFKEKADTMLLELREKEG
ncbi:DUF4176 domain-containing protein [Pseudoflavonifractor sp. An187]|uniref:DUF4176 domain-containing protein n=1 Tax=Pseudoflavonifractor sp. An187 TaxID=1965578 RepID=UPI000B388AFE|nr:DUF4176 domain-containing protein [Pseudoflavonifractor sp. An187]OUP41490.1 hypothetical protein B5F22_10110 [Pseudoflavonifractor sp. An187]